MQPLERTKKRKGGRNRANQRNAVMATPSFVSASRIAPYNLLCDEALERIEEQADWLLEEIGVEFRGDEDALSLFRDAGASITDLRVRFPKGLARHLCSTAPERFVFHARTPEHSVQIGGDNIVLMPGYGSPFVTDLEQGRRYASLLDFQNFIKLAHISPWLHHSGGTVCEPVELPVNKRHLDMVYAHLRFSTKPFMGSVTSPMRAADSIDMVRLAFGPAFVNEHCVIQGNININSPMVFDETMSGALRTYAAANQCVAVSPAIFGGAMGPVSPAAIAAQTLAEGMAGIALTQLVRPGCPVVFGSFHSTMNLKTGALTFGTPEANLVTMALSQLGRRLGVPVRSGGGQITAANAADGQAMQDSADAMWATLLSGAHQVWHAAGWLEGGLTMSYEKFVMDLDHCGMLLRFMQGMAVDDEALPKEPYYQAGPGDNFLSTSHTIRHFANCNYQSELPEAGAFEMWVEAGGLSAEQRANLRYKEMLNSYQMPKMDKAIDEALCDFVARKKQAMPDEWY